MNDLKIQVGEVFKGKRSKVKMQIVKIEKEEVVIKVLDTGETFRYGWQALRHCELKRIEEGE